MGRRMRRAGAGVGWAAVAGVVASMQGCYFVSSGSEARMHAAPARVTGWPEINPREMDEVLWAGPDMLPLTGAEVGVKVGGVGAGMDTAGIGSGGDGGGGGVRVHRAAGALVWMRVDGAGRPYDAKADLGSLFMGFSPNGSVQTGRGFGSVLEALNAILDDDEKWASKTGIFAGPMCAPRVFVQERVGVGLGMRFRIPPKAPDGLKGVVLHLWALASNPYEQEVMAELAGRGWLVVDIDPEDEIVPDVAESSIGEALALAEQVREIDGRLPPYTSMMTVAEAMERQKHPLMQERSRLQQKIWDLKSPRMHLASEEDVEGLARMLAKKVDETLGMNAVVAEAVLDTVRVMYPETRELPTVVMGFSGGGLSAPTVAARLREREGSNLKAVVIVGGAANLVETAAFSTFSDGGVRFETRPLKEGEDRYKDRPNKSPEGLVRKVAARYLELSKLDPYYTAPALNGVPVLQAHAIWDTWVPAEGGELLTERLGDPDMLVMPGGHGMLFYFLPKRKGWIADWVEEKVRE